MAVITLTVAIAQGAAALGSQLGTRP